MQAGEEPVTATWEEARPPHLPDRITAIPVMVWPFVILTAVVVYTRTRLYIGMPLDASNVIGSGLSIATVTAMTLLGAALFLRHPDAWSRLRPAALAVSLIAIGAAMDVLAPHVDGALRSVGIGQEWDGNELPVITASYALGRLASIVGILGVASLAMGLRATRRTPDATRTLVLFVALSIGALGFLAVGYGRILDDGWGDSDQAMLAAANRISIAIHAVGLVAWVAVASILTIGARRRERPTAGWLVGAIATLAIVVGLEPIFAVWPTFDSATSGLTLAGWLEVGTAAVGAVLLLVAFCLGLPEPFEVGETTEPA
jgi:hypothetical protein